MSLHYRQKPSASLDDGGLHHPNQRRPCHSVEDSPTTARPTPPPIARQFGGFLGMMVLMVGCIVLLSFVDGMRMAQRAALHDQLPTRRTAAAYGRSNGGRMPHGAVGGYAMLPAASLATLIEGANLTATGTAAGISGATGKAASVSGHGPHRQHPSRVFPRPLSHPIDSVVVVSFDVFPTTGHGTGIVRVDALDPFERRLHQVVAQAATAAERSHALRDAAVVLMTRAILSRPSGRVVHAERAESDVLEAPHPYTSFFHGRNPSYQTFAHHERQQRHRNTSQEGDGNSNTEIGNATVAVCHTLEEEGRGVPIQFDVVYTHVADDAPSQQRFREAFPSVFFRAQNRFRDWDELRYSMRSVLHRAMCADELSACHYAANVSGGGGAVDDAMSLVRRIYIVVADRDQVPGYLNVSHPALRIVLHAELFAAVGASEHSLPSFNSHAIESTLHAIPGLARFYVYFNNDMMWGRQLSFFDYFRPLSVARQRGRESRMAARCDGDDGVGSGVDTTTVQQEEHRSGAPNISNVRVTIMFEIIHYYENDESSSDFRLVPPTVSEMRRQARQGDALVALGATRRIHQQEGREAAGRVPLNPVASCCPRRGAKTTSATRTGMRRTDAPPQQNCPCNSSYHGVSPTRLADAAVTFKHFHALFKLPVGRRATVASEGFRIFAANNRNYALEALQVAGWPTHSFAHYPRMLDRLVMHDMLDVDLRAAAATTRTHRSRAPTSLWTTMLCHAYHLMHRKVLDWELLLHNNNNKAPRQAEAEATPKQTVAVMTHHGHNDNFNHSGGGNRSHQRIEGDEGGSDYVMWPTVSMWTAVADASDNASTVPQPSTTTATATRPPLRRFNGANFPTALRNVGKASPTPHVPPAEHRPVGLDAILPPYWQHAMYNKDLHLARMRFTGDVVAAATRLAALLAHHGASQRSDQLDARQRTTPWLPNGTTTTPLTALLQPQLCRALRGTSTALANDGQLDFFLPRELVQRHQLDARNLVSRPGFPVPTVDEEARRQAVRPFSNTAIFEECNETFRRINQTDLAAILPSITEIEKLDHHVVKLDQRAGIYHFCMMHSVAVVHRYSSELRATVKLFVTLNDDFARTLPNRAAAAVRELLDVASGHIDAAPWELYEAS